MKFDTNIESSGHIVELVFIMAGGKINPFTQRNRRRPTWQTSRNNRLLALDATDAMVLRQIQNGIRVGLYGQVMASHLFIQSVILRHLLPNHDVTQALVYLSSQSVMAWTDFVLIYLESDALFADIAPEDMFARAHACSPIVHLRIADFSASVLKLDTNFTPGEIELLLGFLQLQPNISIESGIGTNKFYNFTREELILFVLIKLKTGNPNTEMVKRGFGGDARRWSIALRFFWTYVDERIQHHTGLSLLVRYRDSFRTFAEKMADRISKGFVVRHSNGETELVAGKSYQIYMIYTVD